MADDYLDLGLSENRNLSVDYLDLGLSEDKTLSVIRFYFLEKLFNMISDSKYKILNREPTHLLVSPTYFPYIKLLLHGLMNVRTNNYYLGNLLVGESINLPFDMCYIVNLPDKRILSSDDILSSIRLVNVDPLEKYKEAVMADNKVTKDTSKELEVSLQKDTVKELDNEVFNAAQELYQAFLVGAFVDEERLEKAKTKYSASKERLRKATLALADSLLLM